LAQRRPETKSAGTKENDEGAKEIANTVSSKDRGEAKSLFMIGVFIVYLLMVRWVGFLSPLFCSSFFPASSWDQGGESRSPFQQESPFLFISLCGLDKIIFPRVFILKGDLFKCRPRYFIFVAHRPFSLSIS